MLWKRRDGSEMISIIVGRVLIRNMLWKRWDASERIQSTQISHIQSSSIKSIEKNLCRGPPASLPSASTLLGILRVFASGRLGGILLGSGCFTLVLACLGQSALVWASSALFGHEVRQFGIRTEQETCFGRGGIRQRGFASILNKN